MIYRLYILLLFALCSCAVNAPNIGSSKVHYGDSAAVETVNTDFGSTDLNLISQQLATNLISSHRLNTCRSFTVADMRNKTDQYIDTVNITQQIVTQLTNSPDVTSQYVLSAAEMNNQLTELNRQQQHNYATSTSAKSGKMLGAQCNLDGYISNIVKSNSDIKDVFYIVQLKLINIEQGTQLWSSSQQIRKDAVK